MQKITDTSKINLFLSEMTKHIGPCPFQPFNGSTIEEYLQLEEGMHIGFLIETELGAFAIYQHDRQTILWLLKGREEAGLLYAELCKPEYASLKCQTSINAIKYASEALSSGY